MEDRGFAEWTRRIARADSRRRVLGVAAGGLLGALLETLPGRAKAHVSGDAFGYCRVPRQKCAKDRQCCSGNCRKDGRCGCNQRGTPCINGVGIVCCSRKCRNGKCG